MIITTQLLSILRVAPRVQAVHAFCSSQVQSTSAEPAASDTQWAGSVGRVPAQHTPGPHSMLHAPPQPCPAAESFVCTDFERDLMGEHRFHSLLSEAQAPATHCGQALQEAMANLRELRNILVGGVAPRLAAAWATLCALLRDTPSLHGVPAPEDEPLHEAPPGATADHVWLEPAAAGAEDVRALRRACGATGMQLQLLTALYHKARSQLQVEDSASTGTNVHVQVCNMDDFEGSSVFSSFSAARSTSTPH